VLIKGVKRDKIISIILFLIFGMGYLITEIKINTHNAKAQKYYGVHDLNDYNNS